MKKRLTIETVVDALAQSETVRDACIRLGTTRAGLYWWLSQNGYEIERIVRLVPRRDVMLTEAGVAALNGKQQ